VPPAFQARIVISALTAVLKSTGSKLTPREKSSIGVLSPRFFVNCVCHKSCDTCQPKTVRLGSSYFSVGLRKKESHS